MMFSGAAKGLLIKISNLDQSRVLDRLRPVKPVKVV
jgi:hypothetical protein